MLRQVVLEKAYLLRFKRYNNVIRENLSVDHPELGGSAESSADLPIYTERSRSITKYVLCRFNFISYETAIEKAFGLNARHHLERDSI
jgi:hypothetical protein